jgi:hypothetical protein
LTKTFLFFFFFSGIGVWTQGLHLEALHQPFFCDGSWAGLELWPSWSLASDVARIIEVSHQCPAGLKLLTHAKIIRN